jgi:hypothetical protein
MSSKNSPPTPTFLYIGTAKAGSSWIFEALRQHPDVFVPAAKDLKYFDDHYETRSFASYLKYFQRGAGYKAIGELSHDYFTSATYAERIQQHLPNVKLMCCLREPGALAVSSYKYIRMLTKVADVGFPGFVRGYLNDKGYIHYLENLHFFYERFPREHILVTFFDDLQNRPEQFLEGVYSFLDVDTSFRPSILHRQVNAATAPRFDVESTQLSYSLVQWMRRYGLENLVGWLKAKPSVRALLFQAEETYDAKIDEGILRELRLDAAKNYKELERLIGRSIPQAWYAFV